MLRDTACLIDVKGSVKYDEAEGNEIPNAYAKENKFCFERIWR